ncbi:hypothetical protein BDF19DRAFT_449347, partial [Syncephalis fuscata]
MSLRQSAASTSTSETKISAVKAAALASNSATGRPIGVGYVGPSVTGATLAKLAVFVVGLAIGPIATFYFSQDYFNGNITHSAIASIIVANVVVLGYVAVAFLEDRAENKQKL